LQYGEGTIETLDIRKQKA